MELDLNNGKLLIIYLIFNNIPSICSTERIKAILASKNFLKTRTYIQQLIRMNN